MFDIKSSIMWMGMFVALIYVSAIVNGGQFLGIVGIICLSIIGLIAISSVLIILAEIRDQLISKKELNQE